MPPLQSCFKSFADDLLPDYIYIDSSFIVSVLIQNHRHYKESVDFIQRLEEKQTVIVFSELVLTELRCAILKISFYDQFGRDAIFSKKLKTNPELIHRYKNRVFQAEKNFWEILQRFKHRLPIELSDKINKLALQIMPKYCLASYDAVHVATMEEYGVKDVVVLDKDFIKLPRHKCDCCIWTPNGWDDYKRLFENQ